MSSMNIANKLTLLRIALVPFFLACFYVAGLRQSIVILDFPTTYANLFGLILFSIAAFTDWLDGYLARKLSLVSDFGKFMDPLADKMLTTAAFLVFIDQGLIESWMVFLILTREFTVSGLRMSAASKGVVIAAGFSGKFKTVLQFLTVILLLIHPYLTTINLVFIYGMTAATVLSGIEYVLKNKQLLKERT